MNFGEAIKKRREELGLTQQELAQKLFVSRQTVCRWENGTRCPDLIMSKKIALVLGISLDELIPGEEMPDYAPPRESDIDLSFIKVMLTGIFLLMLGTFLIAADTGNMDFAAICFLAGMITFVVGLFIPQYKSRAIIDDSLPQRKCPHCGYDYTGRTV